MASLQPVRGTHDLLPEQNRLQDYIANTAREIGELYGYHRMTTPIFEFTEVFARTLGDTSDVVTKEMYTFEDRGGEQVTLRPEGTAGIARAYISNGMQQMSPVKVSYYGPMFRYERPQKGRQRQFRIDDQRAARARGLFQQRDHPRDDRLAAVGFLVGAHLGRSDNDLSHDLPFRRQCGAGSGRETAPRARAGRDRPPPQA